MVPKFRVWNRKDRKMIYLANAIVGHTYMKINNSAWWIHDEIHLEPISSKYLDDVLMQYTGLFDNKKNELYDKDIVNIWDHDFEPQVAVITWGMIGGWVFDFGHNKLLGAQYIFRDFSPFGINEVFANRRIEKIGNIFENPDLMTDRLMERYHIK